LKLSILLNPKRGENSVEQMPFCPTDRRLGLALVIALGKALSCRGAHNDPDSFYSSLVITVSPSIKRSNENMWKSPTFFLPAGCGIHPLILVREGVKTNLGPGFSRETNEITKTR
jgi:hypothetical protein